jgi:alkaline phosphatase
MKLSTASMALILLLIGLAAVVGCGDATTGEEEAAVLDLTGAEGRQSEMRLPPSPAAQSPVRNVILIVADGLGFAQITAARALLHGPDEPLVFERFPYTGWQTTHALAGSLTDSAAAATAMATGYKTWPGRVAMDAEGRSLYTLLEAAQAKGMATGLVTTSYLLDATPAAFVAHVEKRKMGAEIAAQMAASGVQLLLGGRGKTLKARRGKEPQAVQGFVAAGFHLATEWRQVLAAPAGPLLGLLANGAAADPARQPSLVAMADFAVQRLAGIGEGFFLLLEDEEPDSAGHRQDPARLVRSVRALEKAALAMARFAARHGDTLVLFTADHETGGMLLQRTASRQPPEARFTGNRHSGVPVPIYAYGAGAHRFTGVLDNTEIAWRIAETLGLSLDAADVADSNEPRDER